MAKLYFKVASDWEEVVRLRNEIVKLKQELKNIDSTQSPAAFKTLNTQLAVSTQRMDELVTEAAKAGAKLENDFKRAIDGISTDPLKSFDSELSKMCDNLNKYFDGVLVKLESMSSLLEVGKTEINNPTTNNVSTQQMEDLRVKNAELTEQLRSQKEEIEQQQEEWNKLATVIKSNNLGAIEQYKQATNSSSDSVKKAKAELKDLTKDLNENIKYYDKLAAQIASYKSILDKLYTAKDKGLTRVQIGDGATALISSELERFKPQLDDVTQKSKEIASQISEQRKRQSELNAVIEEGNQKHTRTRTLIMDAREQMIQMRAAGLQNTLQYQQAGEELGKMRKQMVLVNAEMAYLSNPDKNIAIMKTGLQGIAGSASLVVGILGLVNQKNEEMAQIQTKVQSLLGIIIGLENTYGMIKKSSILMLGIENLQRRANFSSMLLERKAKATNIALTWSEVVAQKALNMVAKAHPYVLLATAILTVVGALWALSKGQSEAKKKLEEFNKSVAESAATPIAKVEELSMKWNRLGDNLAAKKKFVEDNKKAFNELGLSILDVVDAENLLNNNKDAFIKAMIERAKAAQYIKQQEENIKELIEAERNLEATKRLTFEDFSNGSTYISAEERKKTAIAAAQYRYDEIAKKIKEGYTLAAKSEEEGSKILDNARIKSTENADNLVDDYTYKMMTGLQRGKDNYDSFIEHVSKGYMSLIESIQDETTTFGDKIGNVLGSIFSFKGNGEDSRLTIGERITQLKTDYAVAQNKLKGLREANSKASQEEINDAEKEVNKLANLYKNLTGKAIEDKSAEEEVDKQKKEAEKRKKEQEKLNEELLSLRRQNQQAEIDLMEDGTEKKLKQIELDYQKELDTIKKHEKELTEKQGGKLTSEQSTEISARYTNAENKSDKAIADVTKEQLKAEQQALNDYLKEYGTFQQQKLAIAEEYAEKIKKAQEESGVNSAQVKLLEKQRDIAIQNKETEAIKANIDWVTVFGEFGGMFNDMIKPALEEAKKYIQTDKFKNSDQASQKSLIDAINQMEKSLGGVGGLNFKKLGQDVKIYQNSLRELNDAKNEEAEAINKLVKAQEDYEKAIKSGTEEEKQAAKDARDAAQQNANAASANVQTQTNAVNESQQNLTDTATKLRVKMDNVVEGLSKLASGGISSAYQGLLQAGSAMKGAIGEVTKNLKDVPIIGWIVAIIDVFKDGLSDVVGGLLDAVFNAVSGILSDVLSGDLFVTIGKSLASGIGKIFNAITFGGFNSWFNIGGNAKETAEKIDSLTASNESLKSSIDGLTKEMEKSNGTKSIEYYQKAKDAQSRSNENYRQILDAQMRYNSSHHSNAYYWDLGNSDLSQVRNLLGKNIKNSWDAFSQLTAEEMNDIRTNLPDVWRNMMDQGKYGDRFKDDWNNYADQADKIEELTEKINENIAQISFNSLRDNFVDTLMDMDASAEDFSKNFEEYLMRSMLNFSIGDMMDERMKRWYEGWTETIGEQEGKLTDDQVKQYKKEWDDMVREGLEKRDQLAELAGYAPSSSSSQESTKKGFAAMSQDTGEELSGRFTALQIAGEEIKNQNITQSESLNILTMKADAILSVDTETKNIANDTRDLIANSYLELVQISENTGAIVKPIQQIQKDIAEVKKNTSKL